MTASERKSKGRYYYANIPYSTKKFEPVGRKRLSQPLAMHSGIRYFLIPALCGFLTKRCPRRRWIKRQRNYFGNFFCPTAQIQRPKGMRITDHHSPRKRIMKSRESDSDFVLPNRFQ